MSRLGIEVGETEMIVYACTLEDKKFVMTNGKMQCVKQVKFLNYKIMSSYTKLIIFIVNLPHLLVIIGCI